MGTEPDRLQELILYIARKMQGDGHLTPSRMKLAKLLFKIDFEAYARRGRSISGSRYNADRLGPAPTDELLATRGLEDDQRFSWDRPWDKMQVPIARDEPRLEIFDSWEVDLVNEVLDRYRFVTAADMVDEAHRFVGWLHAWDDGRGTGAPVMFEAIFWDDSRTAAEPWENDHARRLMASRDDLPRDKRDGFTIERTDSRVPWRRYRGFDPNFAGWGPREWWGWSRRSVRRKYLSDQAAL